MFRISIITIIVVLKVTIIVKGEKYYIKKVNFSTDQSELINSIGIDEVFSIKYRIKSPNGLPLEKNVIFQRYMDGELKEEENFKLDGVLYPNMNLKVDEGIVYLTKYSYDHRLGFELYYLFGEAEWGKSVRKMKTFQLPLKGSLALIYWDSEYRSIESENNIF